MSSDFEIDMDLGREATREDFDKFIDAFDIKEYTCYKDQLAFNIVVPIKDGVSTGWHASLQVEESETTKLETTILFFISRGASTIGEFFGDSTKYGPKNNEYMLKSVIKAIEILNPKWTTMGINTFDTMSTNFEYQRDPYMFCFEEEEKTNVEAVKKILGREELLKILRDNSDEIKEIGNGVAVFRNGDTDYSGSFEARYAYPRYFVRKELSKRGFKIIPGVAEKSAEELNIK